jgi:DNA-binding CsgD family transcriptional regulator
MMDPTSSSNSEESLLLSALCRTDPAAWCLLRPDRRGVSFNTQAFRQLWKLDDGHFNAAGCSEISKEQFAEALVHQGVDADQFLALVGQRGQDGAPPILLVRKDSVRIHADVTLVSSERQILGYLIRFRELVDRNVIDVVLRKILEAQHRLTVLSPRERQILRGIYEGRTNKAISILANISEKTVEKHRSRIMQKLTLNSSAELFQLASRAMLLSDLQQPSDSEQQIEASVNLEPVTRTERP